ncbi:MAG: hypothetical protein WCX82_00740 [archaeon]
MPMITTPKGRLRNSIFQKKAKGTETQKTKREMKKNIQSLDKADVMRTIIHLKIKYGIDRLSARLDDPKAIPILKERIKQVVRELQEQGLTKKELLSKGLDTKELERIFGIDNFNDRRLGIEKDDVEPYYHGEWILKDRKEVKDFISEDGCPLAAVLGHEYYASHKKITREEVIASFDGIHNLIRDVGMIEVSENFGMDYTINKCGGPQTFYEKYGLKGFQQIGLSKIQINRLMSEIKKK